MSVEVKLDDIGEGIESADILEIFVQEGDTISQDDMLLELETDKATAPVLSKYAGTVAKIHVSEGETVAVGAVLLTLETAGADAAAPASSDAPQESAQPPEPAKPEPVQETPPAPPAPAPPAPTPAEPKKPVEVAKAPVTVPDDSDGDSGLIAAGPAVRRFAREVGIDLRRVQGSGQGGRITRDDVLEAVRNLSGGGGTQASTAPAQSNQKPSEGDRVERMSRIRKTIAQKMRESWTTVPRVTNFDDADVTDLEAFRQSSKADYAEKGIKLTSMPFVIKAVATALRNHPDINANVDEANGQIIYKEEVNVGIAVDTERGLVVPNLRGADQQSIPDLARNLQAMAEKVRENKFSPSDLQGSTFTISNLGAIGGTYSTPIVNVPEVAILLIGRSRKMPVVVNDEVVVRLMMPLSLSYDHRLVDGATAARFLNEIIGYLEAPSRLLLAL